MFFKKIFPCFFNSEASNDLNDKVKADLKIVREHLKENRFKDFCKIKEIEGQFIILRTVNLFGSEETETADFSKNLGGIALDLIASSIEPSPMKTHDLLTLSCHLSDAAAAITASSLQLQAPVLPSLKHQM